MYNYKKGPYSLLKTAQAMPRRQVILGTVYPIKCRRTLQEF
jgi:hypothetical protein